MSTLLPCRWRDVQNDGKLLCHSVKFIDSPNPVATEFCRTCVYANHEPPGPAHVVDRQQELALLRDLLPKNPNAPASSSKTTKGRRHQLSDLPPMFCITCWQTPERTGQATEHFRARGLNVQFFPGIHGRTFGLRTEQHPGQTQPMTAGQIGCALSHYLLWQALAYLPHEEVLILEDDAYLEPDFSKHFRRAYAELPADWQFVFVGGVAMAGKPIERVTERVGVMRYPCGTHAYLVKRSIVPFLLQTNHQARYPVDLHLIENSLPALKCYIFTPCLAKQRSDVSPTEGTGEGWPSTTAALDLDHPAALKTYNDIDGWFGFSDVYDLAVQRASGGETFVEIGAWKGKSTAYMATRIKQSGKTVHFFTVDTFQGSADEEIQRLHVAHLQWERQTLYDVFSDNLKACGLRDDVTPIIADSASAAEGFPDRSVAFCFIDGCHSYAAVLRDIRAWLPKMKPRGLLGGDDFAFPGVTQAVCEIFGRRVQLSQQSHKSWYVEIEK